MKRFTTITAATLVALLLSAPAALACGFLVSANGAVRLDRTTTFVAWEDGIEHYITNFEFQGPAEAFGSLIPLPAEPLDVLKAGEWTLQRLRREVVPPPSARDFLQFAASADSAEAEVLLRKRIDSLDVVVLRGGGQQVLEWVNDNGFNLPEGPHTDHMLKFYGDRSPYFLAARFDPVAAAADEFIAGDGIPIQIIVPTEQPWVPLHILHGASPDTAIIEADIFLLTPERPELLHGEGITLETSEWANQLLLDDLRSDENMEWVPEDAWFTYLALETEAENVVFDLSVGVEGIAPSYVDAGLTTFEPTERDFRALGLEPSASLWEVMIGALIVAGVGGLVAAAAVHAKNG